MVTMTTKEKVTVVMHDLFKPTVFRTRATPGLSRAPRTPYQTQAVAPADLPSMVSGAVLVASPHSFLASQLYVPASSARTLSSISVCSSSSWKNLQVSLAIRGCESRYQHT